MATLEIVFGRKKLLDGEGPFCDNVFKNPARRFCKMSIIDAKWPNFVCHFKMAHFERPAEFFGDI